MSREGRSTDDILAATKSAIARPPGQSLEELCLLVSTTKGFKAWPLKSRRLVIGRSNDADIVAPDDSVSRRHAELLVEPGRIQLVDLGSHNGVVVDGVRLAPRATLDLYVGITFRLGNAVIVLQNASAFLGESRGDAVEREPGPPPEGLVLEDPAMRKLYALLEALASTSLSILLLGETGVGKEIFAEALHKRSPRADKKFVTVNCAAIQEQLLESDLFGHERGAFTGADKTKLGLFEVAHEGTLFLDEIGEMPFGTQSKLLRALESGEIRRVGGVDTRRVDVRIVAATNRDLNGAIAQGTFRPDLFYRINGFSLTIPPLSEREGDILPLARLFLHRACAKLNRKPPSFTEGAMTLLRRHSWPGNIRELRQVMERTAALYRGERLEPEDLYLPIVERPRGEASTIALPPPPRGGDDSERTLQIPVIADQGSRRGAAQPESVGRLDKVTRDAILDALNQAAGNQSEAARILGISRGALVLRLEHFGIARPRKRR